MIFYFSGIIAAMLYQSIYKSRTTKDLQAEEVLDLVLLVY